MDILKEFNRIISESSKPIVYEFGACDGYHTRMMVKDLVDNGKAFEYHAFEPVLELFNLSLLPTTYSLPNGQIGKYRISNKAIAAKTGKMILHKSDGIRVENGRIVEQYYASSSIREPKIVTQAWPNMTFTDREVDTITFDDYVNEVGHQDSIIDFIWADIQGAEIDLILGGALTFPRVKYFYTEYNNSELYEGLIGLDQIVEMLPGFEIVFDFQGDVLLKNTALVN